LLGAGFSRNWGGLLAGEVFDALLGQQDIHGDQYLRAALWANRTFGGFENALADVQRAFLHAPAQHALRLERLQRGVMNVFSAMNNAFFAMPWMEFQQHQERMLRTFLFRFDAIFTLNQDVLLEHHYFRHLDLPAVRPWGGPQLPGMRRIPNPNYVPDTSWGKDQWVPMNPGQFQIEDRYQPLFKLHGSTNWRNTEGGQLLVIGGDKSQAIQSHQVLAWSFDRFNEYLNRPDTKLMVIGYGFRDQHINRPIINAVSNSGLRFFVIDRLGPDVVRHANPSFGGAIYASNDLDDAFQAGLIGASQRNLSETFGNDAVSHNQIMNFFA
jgi:hypothetical protein